MKNIEKAVEILKNGGIIIYPTDTAFGIGCSLNNEVSIRKLYKLLKRPEDMASPVLFDSIERVEEYVQIEPRVRQLTNKYWPGPLTIILNCNREKVPSPVRDGGNTLGVRIADHKIPIEIIKRANVPILGTSANFHGGKTPFLFSELDKRLIKLVDFVVEGKTKGKRQTSTIVDCTKYPWKIIRQGQTLLDL